MSTEKTSFSTLPNEIIYCIFEFLKTSDIMKAFVQLNYRYRDVVRHYVKHIDLTDSWQIYRSELQYICQSVESVKVNRYGLDLFTNYQFPQLHSLFLINIVDWEKLLCHMSLQNLKIWFQSDDDNYDDSRTPLFGKYRSLPLTIRRFSSNGWFNPTYFHENLTHLNVCVSGIYNLLEITERTRNIQHLSVHFNRNFDTWDKDTDDVKNDFEAVTTNFQRLTNLNFIAFTTLNSTRGYNCNGAFPFYQLQLFIDNCCPKKTILKKVTLQLFYISFDEDVWSIIQQYKNTFDSFNVYILFDTEDNLEQTKNEVLSNNEFVCHIVDHSYDTEINYSRVYLYSLPFHFTELYGFTCYSNLDQQCSYSAVRHLYFTKNPHNRMISFQSLEKQMPNLVSIDCGPTRYHTCAHNTLKNYDDILYNVQTLYYKVTCNSSDCIYSNQFCPTVGRMPNLKVLTASIQTFNQLNHPLMFLKKLHLHNCQYIDFDKLATLVPNVCILLLTGCPRDSYELSSWIHSLFVRFSQLIVLSLLLVYERSKNQRSEKKVAEEILTIVQNMDSKFQYLKLTFDDRRMVFFFSNQ